MDNSSAPKIKPNVHRFDSADGTVYVWEEKQVISEMFLETEEIEDLRNSIKLLPDHVIQNDVSGNGIKMGIQVPLSQDRLNKFLQIVLDVIKLKAQFKVELSGHAISRLEEDMLNGEGHPDFRGWLSEEDVHQCVATINQVEGARLTINKHTLKDPEIKFNSSFALEIRGVKPNGEEGTLALAVIEANKVRIITLL